MKRWFIIAGLMMLFFVALFGLAGCGLLSEASDTDLTNSVGSENGPGSGKWKPQVPKTALQARQLFAVLESLSKKGTEEADAYDKLYVLCFDKNKELRPDKKAEECFPPLIESATMVRQIFVDFHTGSTVWDIWAEENGDGEDPPEKPNPPDPPKEDPPKKEDPEDDEDDDYYPWCLTCLHGIAPEYVFHPVEIDVVFSE